MQWIGPCPLPSFKSNHDQMLRTPSRFELVILPRIMAIVLVVSGVGTALYFWTW